MRSNKRGWLVPAGLIFLSALPLLGAVTRVMKLAGLATVTVDDARFLAAPVPILVHALSSPIYFVVGAFQFSPSFRLRHPQWHRIAGRVLIPCGLLTALTGMWMALTYPGGSAIAVIRLVVGAAMLGCISLGFAAIRRGDVARHRPWMMRAYALAIAAGTQPFTLAPVLLVPKPQQDAAFVVGMTAGWVINIAVAEWFIRRQSPRHAFVVKPARALWRARR